MTINKEQAVSDAVIQAGVKALKRNFFVQPHDYTVAQIYLAMKAASHPLEQQQAVSKSELGARTMILYFVTSGEALCGYNADLFVWAERPLDAVLLWRTYFDLSNDTLPDRVWVVPTIIPSQPLVADWEHLEKIPDEILPSGRR